MSGVVGNFAGLTEIVGKLEGMQDLVESIAIEASVRIEDCISRQFLAGEDPYGNPWAPLAASTLRRGRRPPPLTDTGAMLSSVTVYVTQSTIEVTVADPARIHQDGGEIIPQRKIIPDAGDPLPQSWEDAIREAGMLVMQEAWG